MPCEKNSLCNMADTRLHELEKRWDLAHRLLIEKIDKEAALMNIRLEGMNKFREQLNTERLEYLTRREAVLISMIVSILLVIAGTFITHMIIGK